MFKRKCYFCKREEKGMSQYLGDYLKPINVCYLCEPYAQRRGFKKLKHRQTSYSYYYEDDVKNTPALSFIVALLILSFIGTYIFGNGSTDLNTARLFGAITPTDATTNHFIRTITYTFVHIGGPIHILLNLSLIISAGPFLEKVYGPFWFTILFFITGAFGGLFVLMFSDLNVIVGGASGAGYGLIGLYLGLVLKKHSWINPTIRNWVINLFWINIVWTFFATDISIAGHLGGLISGILLALIIPTNGQSSHWVTGLLKSVIAFIIVIVLFLLPSKLAPNKELPYIQQIREAINLEVVNDFPIQNSDLIYPNLINNWLSKINQKTIYLQTETSQIHWPIDINHVYLEDFDGYVISEIFNANYFYNLTINSYPDVVMISGYYNGEIVQGEESYLEFTLVPSRENYLKVQSISYNGQYSEDELTIASIMEVITTPLRY